MALEGERSSLNGVGRSVLDPGWTIGRGRDGDRGCSATRRAGRRRNRHAYSSRQRPGAASEQGLIVSQKKPLCQMIATLRTIFFLRHNRAARKSQLKMQAAHDANQGESECDKNER
jgi:hypothetical protein